MFRKFTRPFCQLYSALDQPTPRLNQAGFQLRPLFLGHALLQNATGTSSASGSTSTTPSTSKFFTKDDPFVQEVLKSSQEAEANPEKDPFKE